MKNDKTKNIILGVLLVAVLTLTIAYAVLTAQLSISSQATVGGKNNNWNIHFSTINGTTTPCTAKAGTTAAVNVQPAVASTTISGLAVTLRAPGDEITCDFTIDNDGVIPAKLVGFAIQDANTNITYTGNGATASSDESLVQNGLITYSVTYNNDVTYNNQVPTVNNTLPVGTKRPIRLTISIPSTVTAEQIPYNDVSITNLLTVFDYQQD